MVAVNLAVKDTYVSSVRLTQGKRAYIVWVVLANGIVFAKRIAKYLGIRFASLSLREGE